MTYQFVLPPDRFAQMVDRVANDFVLLVYAVEKRLWRGEKVAQPNRLE
jgi:hypothetical protein